MWREKLLPDSNKADNTTHCARTFSTFGNRSGAVFLYLATKAKSFSCAVQQLKLLPCAADQFFRLFSRKRVVLSFDDGLHRRRVPSSSRLLCLSIPSLRPLVSTKSATLQTCSVALSFKWVFFSRIPVSLMDSARREIFGMVSWFDRLLSVHDLHSGRQMFPCSAHALACSG